ncbi:MAG: choice-of-anchor L domain-containing protein [Crocinitomicaceae bacterium]
MNNRILIAIFTLISFIGFNQIAVTNTLTPAQLVNNVLIGSGVTATNITINGSAANANSIQSQATYFNQNGTTFPIADGMLLSTGQGSLAVGPNNSGSSSLTGPQSVTDPDMAMIATGTMFGGVVLEFDFVATGNQLEFNYIFGSEEYPEFVNGGVNDCFGFFLSGPGLAGPYSNGGVNIALIPGTNTPITIDDVNAGSNSQYYVNNTSGLGYGTAIQYDGTTTELTAFSELICGETYHIKIGLTNISDNVWDSGVFLEGGSFTTNPVAFSFSSFTNNNIIYEGCDQIGVLSFEREGCNTSIDTLVAYIYYGGQATNGIDYTLLGDSVVLLPGVDSVAWLISPYEDGILEGIESIQLTVMSILITGDTIYSYGTFYIDDVPELFINSPDVNLYCMTDSTDIFTSASGGFAPYAYEWNTLETDSAITVPITVNGIVDYYVTATDFCGYEISDTVSVNMNQTLAIDTMMMWPSNACDPTGVVQGVASGLTVAAGQPYYNWTGPGTNPGPFNIDASVLEDIPSGWYYFTVTDDVCTVDDSIFVEPLDPPVAQFTPSPSSGCTPLTVTFTNNSQNTSTYFWDFGNGQTASVGNANSQTQTYTSNATVMLIAYSDPTCSDTTYANISISICGCMDPNAVNYDPTAAVDDGSCAYPQPEVIAPNVFTPNNDGNNSFFVVDTRNVVQLELTVLNRWGNVMYTADENITLPGSFVGWNGKTASGADAQEGTYFYTYLATGIDGNQAEGHGFLELIRD